MTFPFFRNQTENSMSGSIVNSLLSILMVILSTLPQYSLAVVPFRDNDLLTCMVPSPEGGSIPEPRKRLAFQPGEPGTVWRPVKSM